MSLKNTKELINFDLFQLYHSKMSALQEANTNKIAQIVGELAGATAQLAKTTTKVNCDHRYEITGATGDEHNLAIEDQQMLINKISGRTLVRNQLIPNNDKWIFGDLTGNITYTLNDDNSITINGTVGEKDFICYITGDLSVSGTRKLFISGCPKGGSWTTYFVYDAWSNNIDLGNSVIYSTSQEDISLWIVIKAGVTVNNLTFKPQLIDLTQAYGLGKEPTTVEEILNDFPEYIPYDEGTFVHSNNELVSTGKNLFNQDKVLVEQEFTRQSDGSYYIDDNAVLDKVLWENDSNYQGQVRLIATYYHIGKIGYMPICWYKDGTFEYVPWYSGVNVWATYHYTSQSGKIVDKILWSASEYEPTYVKDMMITTDLTSTGYEPYKEEVIEVGELKEWDYKDNQSGNDVFGTGELDLGDLDWYLDGSQRFSTELPIEDIKVPDAGFYSTIRCEKYTPSNDPIGFTGKDKTISVYTTKHLYLYDFDYTDATTFKQAMKGVKLIYQKATPTIVENYNLPAGMAVYKGGLQEQKGTIPYVIEKQYALSVASQVLQNIEIDREQQEQIDNMKGDIAHKQPLLFSGQNIKTFNGKSILGSGDLAWNDPMFLAKFNRVTLVDNIIDEFLEGKQYRIYSNSDTGLNFDIQVRINLTDLATGGAFDYVNLNLYSSKNYIDFQYVGYSLSSNSRTIYINYILNGAETTKTYTYNGSDYVIADVINNGSISIVGTYAAVFEPVELLTKEDLVEIKPIQSIKETLTVGERGEINLSKMPILIKPIYMYNKTKGNSYYLFYELSSASNKCMKNGRLKEISEIFYSLSLYPTDDTKAIEFNQSEYDYGDIIEVIYEYGYIDPAIFIEA